MNEIKKDCILGRGCDPVRAAFAKEQWEPILDCEIDTATSDKELLNHLKSGKRYKVFFLAPGQCSLAKAGIIKVADMISEVEKHQPGIKILMIDEVSKALPMLSNALGRSEVKGVKSNSGDWPFVD